MRPIIFVGFALILAFTPATHASNVTDAERDLEAMQGIAEAFCNAMNICEKKEYGKFTVYRYYAEETEKLLSPTELKILADCTEKFQVKITADSSERIHIYCYDNSLPRLLLEKGPVNK